MATTKIPASAQATKGTTIWWAPATTPGTKPLTGWAQLPGIVTYPKIGGSPDSFETTTLDEDQMKTYCIGLLDSGGAQEVTFNTGKEIIAVLSAMYVSQTSGKELWIKIVMPKPYNMEYYYAIQMSPIVGHGEIGINAVMQDTFGITYVGYWQTAAGAV